MAESLANLAKGDDVTIESTTVKDANNNDVTFYKYGKVVMVAIRGSYTVSSGAYPTVVTIPEGYRPMTSLDFSVNTNSSASKPNLLQVNPTAGTIKLNGYLSAGTLAIYQTMTWLID